MKNGFLLLLALFFFSCSVKEKPKIDGNDTIKKVLILNEIKTKDSCQDTFEPISMLVSDSSEIANYYVKLHRLDGNFGEVLEWGNDKNNWKKNIWKLTQNRGYEKGMSVIWKTKAFINLQTLSSGSFSDHLFLPLDKRYKPFFVKNNEAYTDTTYYFVVSSVHNYENVKMSWTITSLKTGESENFLTPLLGAIVSPFYTAVCRENKSLKIEFQNGKVIYKDISKFCE
jgi:hypothetical protein